MIMGTTKRCWKCRQSFETGDCNVMPYTCSDCRVETFHFLEPSDEYQAASACGKFTGWPHSWPNTQGYIVTPAYPAKAEGRMCSDCLKVREPVATGQE